MSPEPIAPRYVVNASANMPGVCVEVRDGEHLAFCVREIDGGLQALIGSANVHDIDAASAIGKAWTEAAQLLLERHVDVLAQAAMAPAPTEARAHPGTKREPTGDRLGASARQPDSVHDEVEREARRAWLDERPAPELPDLADVVDPLERDEESPR